MGKFVQWLERFEKDHLPGVAPRTLKHHYSLIPVHLCIVVGLTWAAYFSFRTAVYSPDSTCRGYDAYEYYRDGRYFKFFNISGLKPDCKAPIYKREGDPSDESYALPDY